MRNEIQNLMEELNNMFYTEGGYQSFPIDVIEEEKSFVVYAEIPGVDKKDIKLSYLDGKLTILATQKKNEAKGYLVRERNTLKYQREIYFKDLDEDSIHAKYADGVLEITINKKAKEEKTKKVIEIQ